VHPLNPVLGRKRRARRVLALLDDCAREIRGLVAVAADPEASHDARLAAACWRVQDAVEALTEGGPEQAAPVGRPPVRAGHAERPAANGGPALAHLHGLERALAELAHPLRAGSGSPLVGA
jgi:hypothetical protein